MAPVLVIPVGIPGCGKSSWAKDLFDLKYAVVSSDAIRKNLFGSLNAAHNVTPEQKADNNTQVFDAFHHKIDEHLRYNIDVFADATNLNPFAREKLVDIAEEHQAETHLILFTNVGEAIIRNSERDEDELVPKDAMLTMVVKYYDALTDIEDEDYDRVTKIASIG